MPATHPGTRFIDYAGYSRCLVLENADTRVVLDPHCGGRILEYSHRGKNSICLDHRQDGWKHVPGKPGIDPYGGRFDIGPEMTIPKHPVLWLGEWQGKITGARSAQLTSRVDHALGVQVVRKFQLDAKTSHLRCTQIIRNVSKKTKEYCHWSRTLAVGGGICLIPVTPNSRFPNSYIMYEPRSLINYRPSDPKIKFRDGFLELMGPPKYPKLGFDSHAGWFAYLMPNDLIFVKRFPVFPDRQYNEVAAITISIYFTDKLCELEPIGPRERIEPGASVSYTEDWRLLEYAFPSGSGVNSVRKRPRRS